MPKVAVPKQEEGLYFLQTLVQLALLHDNVLQLVCDQRFDAVDPDFEFGVDQLQLVFLDVIQILVDQTHDVFV